MSVKILKLDRDGARELQELELEQMRIEMDDDRLRHMIAPDDILFESIERYVNDRTETGAFLRAVLENDLTKALAYADIQNRRRLYEIVSYLWSMAPAECWGSKAAVARWLGEKA